MIRSLLKAALSLLPSRTITGRDGAPYLTKHTLVNLGRDSWRAHLHEFHRGDEDAALHSHPWKAVGIILSGGYREERRWDGGVVHKTNYLPGMVNVIGPDTFHRVDLLGEKCWTLFISGPVVASWGFWDRVSNVYTPWREFIAAKGITPRSGS